MANQPPAPPPKGILDFGLQILDNFRNHTPTISVTRFSVTFTISVSSRLTSDPLTLFSLDDLIRLHQKMRRNPEPEGFGGLEVNHQLEFRGLFDWQIGWLGALENFIHERGNAPPGF